MAKYQYTPEEKKYVDQGAFLSFWTFVGGAPQVMQSKSVAVSLKPALVYFYGGNGNNIPKEELDILVEHADTYFNSHTVGVSLVTGIVLAMEKERAKGNATSESIQAIKASLMGPTAGIGDSFYFNCVRVIAAGVGIGLVGDSGSWLGAWVFLLIFGGFTVFSKWYLFHVGYEGGVTLVEQAFKTGLVPLISKASSILGLIMVGALVASTIKINVKFAPSFGGAVIKFQDILDSIAPGILKICLWWVVFQALQKGRTPIQLIWIIMGTCVVLSALTIL